MNTDPTQLAIKIGKYIQASNGCSYTDIKNQAAIRGIDPDTLEQALLILHRQKTIHRTVAGGDVQYLFRVPVAKPVTAVSQVEWVTQHYPWPGKGDVPEFVMPFPEIDMSFLFLKTLEERQAYKEAAAGRYVAPEWYEHPRV